MALSSLWFVHCYLILLLTTSTLHNIDIQTVQYELVIIVLRGVTAQHPHLHNCDLVLWWLIPTWLAKWDIPSGDGVECSRVARKVVSSSPARGTHTKGYKWRYEQDGFVAFVSGGRRIKWQSKILSLWPRDEVNSGGEICDLVLWWLIPTWLAKWDIPSGDGVECSRVARKVVSSSPARGTHTKGYITGACPFTSISTDV